MITGSVVYPTEQGLGILAKSFCDHGVVNRVIAIKHHTRTNHWQWYDDNPDNLLTTVRKLGSTLTTDWLKGADQMLFFETPFDWELLDRCRRMGIKTALMPMYECMPRDLPARPDRFFCPSLLDLQHFPVYGTFMPVPVDTIRVPWRLRHRAYTFVHNAGFGGLKERNGTKELLEAWQYVKSPAKLLLRSQTHLDLPADPRIRGSFGTMPYEHLYSEGDVFIFPEKFNGLSLPLQEARASGMLVMATDRFPMNSWLPTEPLIPKAGTVKSCISGRCIEFDEAVLDPVTIAAKVDEWYGRDVGDYSLSGREWAEANSWNKLGSGWLEALS